MREDGDGLLLLFSSGNPALLHETDTSVFATKVKKQIEFRVCRSLPELAEARKSIENEWTGDQVLRSRTMRTTVGSIMRT